MILNIQHQEVKEVTVYICSVCEDSFNDNEEVVLHMVNNHQNEEKIEEILNKIPGIPQTTRGNKSKRKFQRSIKEYQCRYCNYRTVHYSTYKRHLLTHQKSNQNHKCPHCSFASKQKSNLVRHLRDLHLNGTVDLEPVILINNTEKGISETKAQNVIMILKNN